jgi:hypothetical protein
MTGTSLKLRLDRARTALRQTLQNILDINKKRKSLPSGEEGRQLKHRLRLLNKMAETHALLVRLYERRMAERSVPAQESITGEQAPQWQHDRDYSLLLENHASPSRQHSPRGFAPVGYRPDLGSRKQMRANNP